MHPFQLLTSHFQLHFQQNILLLLAYSGQCSQCQPSIRGWKQMSGQWNDIVCKTIIVTLTTCWLWRVMSTVNGRHEINNQKHYSLHVDLKILIPKRERGADGVWTIENKTRSSRCLNVQRESWVLLTPPPPPRVQVMVPRCSSLSSAHTGHLPGPDKMYDGSPDHTHSIHLSSNTTTFSFFVWGLKLRKTEMSQTNYIYYILSGLW